MNINLYFLSHNFNSVIYFDVEKTVYLRLCQGCHNHTCVSLFTVLSNETLPGCMPWPHQTFKLG